MISTTCFWPRARALNGIDRVVAVLGLSLGLLLRLGLRLGRCLGLRLGLSLCIPLGLRLPLLLFCNVRPA